MLDAVEHQLSQGTVHNTGKAERGAALRSTDRIRGQELALSRDAASGFFCHQLRGKI
jgi:hypothetical protein